MIPLSVLPVTLITNSILKGKEETVYSLKTVGQASVVATFLPRNSHEFRYGGEKCAFFVAEFVRIPFLMPNQSYLRRLPPEWYRGNAYVHWSISIEKKKSGWLNPLFHAQWRELHLHVLQRYQLVCLAYCLMPDHVHILWKGVHPDSDQRKAMRFFRLHWNALLKPFSLQKQGYDHMLRDKECDADALSDTMRYIFENPVRASLVEERHAWAYAGSLVSGYPDLDARKDFYKFWEIVNRGEG